MQFPEGLENTPFKFKVLNYSRNYSLHATLIPNLMKPLIYNNFSISYDYNNLCQKSLVAQHLFCSIMHNLSFCYAW